MPAPLTNTVSTKGQVIRAKSIRGRHDWDAGTRLVVEDKPAASFCAGPSASPQPGPRTSSPASATTARP